MLTLPTDDVTIEQAAWLLADAKHPGADEKTRVHNFRLALNELLFQAKAGERYGRMPGTGTPTAPEGINAHDYVQIMVLTPNDIKRLAAERDIEFQTVAPETDDKPASETPAERRARRLVMFEAEEKRGKRGALQRVADKEGVDHSNLSKELKKARKERGEQRSSGTWAMQLVRDGKRTA